MSDHLTSIYGIKKGIFTLMTKRSFEKSKLTPCQECLTERKNEHVFLFVTTLNTKQQRRRQGENMVVAKMVMVT